MPDIPSTDLEVTRAAAEEAFALAVANEGTVQDNMKAIYYALKSNYLAARCLMLLGK